MLGLPQMDDAFLGWEQNIRWYKQSTVQFDPVTRRQIGAAVTPVNIKAIVHLESDTSKQTTSAIMQFVTGTIHVRNIYAYNLNINDKIEYQGKEFKIQAIIDRNQNGFSIYTIEENKNIA